MRATGDRGVWAEATRDVRPLHPRGALPQTRAPSLTLSTAEQPAAKTLSASPSLDRFGGIDRANAERLKRGQRKIEARLDLHGMTQTEAHRELVTFVAASHAAGRRCVLVITGRGLAPGGSGILKSSVPRWLEEPALRRRVLAIAPAQPRDGGAGALYLLLRRDRPEAERTRFAR